MSYRNKLRESMQNRNGEFWIKVFEADGVSDFDPEQIFDCGQCFRWQKAEDGFWEGIVGCGLNGRRAVLVFDDEQKLLQVYEAALNRSGADYHASRELEQAGKDPGKAFAGTERFWREYFDLDKDYGAIKTYLADGDATMAKAIEFGRGIRILKQDKWETIVSFIISQNNNIPRIKKCIDSVAKLCGGPGGSLPEAKDLAKLEEEDLAPCRLGYRAKYLIKAARQVVEDGLPENNDQLRCLCGVGPKVANCIELFGLGNADSFPIDVWMKRVMNELYGIPETDVKAMQEYAAEHFAPYGGIAQQYLFYYITHRSM